MKNVRVWFKKIGTARYISHLDLNRCMLRAIHKAKIPLWYTQGYNPHAFITFALPLSLGIGGERESMDIKLDDDNLSREELIARLNAALPDDIPIFDVTEPVMKPGQIAYASFLMKLDTQDMDSAETAFKISELFSSNTVVVPKHTKNGFIDLDLKPYLYQTEVVSRNGRVEIGTVLPAGSTMNVNPALLCDAIKKYLGFDLYADIQRINIFDADLKIFE
nr:TIGR03936 family radical SAM-associated protein [uncultured Caproiciproducens sp.]